MTITIWLVCLVLAFIFFLLAAFKVAASVDWVNLAWAALTLAAISYLA